MLTVGSGNRLSGMPAVWAVWATLVGPTCATIWEKTVFVDLVMAVITLQLSQLAPSSLVTFVPAITSGDVPPYWLPRPNPATLWRADATTNGANVAAWLPQGHRVIGR